MRITASLLSRLAAGLSLGLCLTTAAPAQTPIETLSRTVAAVEDRLGARIGVTLVDTGSDMSWSHRTDERFLMNSTAKTPICAALLAQVDAGALSLSDTLVVEQDEILSYAPVTETRVGDEMTLAELCLAALDMSYDDLGKVEYLPFAESVELMKNRQLDATLQSSGLGSAALKDLSSTQDVTYVSIPAEVAETLGAPYAAGVIPAGTYPGQDADVPTLAITNVLVTSSDVSDELAYQMTKLLFENLDQLKAAHAAAGDIDLETAIKNAPIPLHPGAERFYKEQGLL